MLRLLLLGSLLSICSLRAAEETPEQFAIAAKRLYDQGDLNGALLGYDKAISLAEDRPAYYYERARVKLGLSKPRHAIVDLRIAVMFDENFGAAWQLLGIANYLVSELAEAHRCLYLSIVLDNKNAKSWLWCGIVSQKLGEDESAIDYIKKGIEYEPKSSLAWYHYGLSLAAGGKPILAADKFTRALELDKTDAGCYHARALAYLQNALKDTRPQPFFDAASRDLVAAKKLRADLVDRQSTAALMQILRGDMAAAVTALRADLRSATGDIEIQIRLRLWAVLTLMGETESAMKVLAIDLKKQPYEIRKIIRLARGEKVDFDTEVQDIDRLTRRWFCLGIGEFLKRTTGAGGQGGPVIHLELCSIRPVTFEGLLARYLLKDIEKSRPKPKK